MFRVVRLCALTLAFIFVSSVAADKARADPRSVSIMWLMLIDWDADYPEAPQCLANSIYRPPDWTVTYDSIFTSDIDPANNVLLDYDMVVTTGHAYHQFTPTERAVLEQYILAGGLLWIDDCGNIEIDNMPFDLEVDFGYGQYSYWGLCYGAGCFTVDMPDHPLVNSLYTMTAAQIRTDPGMNASQRFTPFYDQHPDYDVVISGGPDYTFGYTGPFVLAERVGAGRIVLTAGDLTCALKCQAYGNPNMPAFDYKLVYNMLAWVDSDGDTILDHDEGAFDNAGSANTNGDATSDYLHQDSDGDLLPDALEAGDVDLETPPVDTDGDGIPDFQDPDSDNDGIADGVEWFVDTDGDGVENPDVDGDGVWNHLDDDTDGDGLSDAVEGTGDIDGDGIPDFADADPLDGPLADPDGDGIANGVDNCPAVANPGQDDTDGDGAGDACDDDDDDDLVLDVDDNCPLTQNGGQEDLDGDGVGDACDSDRDGDGVDNDDDNCPDLSNPGQQDLDGDGDGDACDPDRDGDGVDNGEDNCPDLDNPDKEDLDGDGVGDACDPDRDGDGVDNDNDNCPELDNPGQEDSNSDGIGDACEGDADSDGVVDGLDNCPEVPNPDQIDTDDDGVGDLCQDSDGDGVMDPGDNCPSLANPDQADADGDGVGDACEDPESPASGCGCTATRGSASSVPTLPLLLLLGMLWVWYRRRTTCLSGR